MDRPNSRISLHEILTTGLVAGVIYFILNLVRFFPREQLALMASGFL